MRRVTRYIAHTIQIGGLLLLLAQVSRAEEESRAQAQLAALLRDRPKLATTLETRPKVRDWILQRLDEADPPIYWDPMPPVSGRAAEWDARDSTVTALRIDGSPSGIDQLAHLLFELHNVQGYASFACIHEEAVRGTISRDEYASQMLEQEFRALIAVRAFYREYLSDLSPSEEKKARSYYRLLYGTGSFEEHVRKSLERGVDLRDHYRFLFDSIVLAEREKGQQSKEREAVGRSKATPPNNRLQRTVACAAGR